MKSYFYITDAQAGMARRPAGRVAAEVQLSRRSPVITSHEVMPGHYVHSVFMRKTPGKIRRIWIGLNPFPQPSSGQDGWAHYAEQMMLDEGFRADDPRYRMAQTERRADAHLPVDLRHSHCTPVSGPSIRRPRSSSRRRTCRAPAARQEAERGTYDPTYGGYFLGKMPALKLRDDVQAARGRRSTCASSTSR